LELYFFEPLSGESGLSDYPSSVIIRNDLPEIVLFIKHKLYRHFNQKPK